MSYRLLKVVCQAVLVSEDDNGNLVEHVGQPVTVSAAEWPSYPTRLNAEIITLSLTSEQAEEGKREPAVVSDH